MDGSKKTVQSLSSSAGWKDIVAMFQTGGETEIDAMQFQIKDQILTEFNLSGRSEVNKCMKSCKDIASFSDALT